MIEETGDTPRLVGRPDVIQKRMERAGLSRKVGTDFTMVNPERDNRYRHNWQTYHHAMDRKGVTPNLTRAVKRTA